MKHPELTYRFVAGAEMAKVREFLAAHGEPLPHFLLSCAWIAENPAGEIVAISQCQSLPVIEPFQVFDDRYDGGEVALRLFAMTKEFILASGVPRILMHPNHPAMRRMLERVGAHPVADQFYDWRR
jgi:hypothetical protein